MSAADIKAKAELLAIAAGYRWTNGNQQPRHLRAGPGKFVGEPWCAPYFWDRMLNGDGTLIDHDGEHEVIASEFSGGATLLDVSDEEREAFGLHASTVAVTLWESGDGFVYLTELSQEERDNLTK